MAKRNKPIQQPVRKVVVPKDEKKTISQASAPLFNLFDFLENHFSSNRKKYLIALVLLAVFFSFITFDVKISTANDDALYIEAGSNYAKNFFGYFYTANAPLYPIFLGIFVKIFGVKLLGMKLMSIVFFALAVYFTFRAFETLIPYVILIPALLITVTNFPYLMYASLTYSETFSFMVFALGFFVVNRSIDSTNYKDKDDREIWWAFVLIGFLFFVQMLTRNVALISIGVVLVYLIYRKRYIGTGITAATFGLLYVLYKLSLSTIWKIQSSQFSEQYNRIFQKDAYQPQMGKETFGGFITRFIDNCNIYVSSQLMYAFGFREESSPVIGFVTLVVVALIGAGLYLMWRNRQHVLIFSTLFFVGLLAITFLTLQTSWAQTRLIMIYIPFILFALFYVFYRAGIKLELLQFVYLAVFAILFLFNISLTGKNIAERVPLLISNMTDDPTAGYTPDWQNYIKMSQWCAQNLPDKTKNVAVRKAPMSFIFTNGKEFYGIYGTPYQDADSLLTPLRDKKIEYIMDARLRVNPTSYIEGQFISTIYRYMYFIAQKYPLAFTQIQQIGDIEEARLYQINWNYIDSLKQQVKTGN